MSFGLLLVSFCQWQHLHYTTKTAEEEAFSPIASTTFGPKAECEKSRADQLSAVLNVALSEGCRLA
jgi:hypothetical protein